MINLLLICLLLFGIGYLAFSNTETTSKSEVDTDVPFSQCVDEEMQAEFNCPDTFFGKSAEGNDLIK